MSSMAVKLNTHEPSSSNPLYCRRRWNYDVFLSFRGEDSRKNFTDHLYHALKDAGVNTFRDDNELRRGEDIATELLKAIQDSRISVIVFSRNYADSRWCLEELVKIMECREAVQQLVLPIFYKVDPSDVRKQTGSFEEAFVKHEERFVAETDMVLRWRAALTKAANLSGWDLTSANGYESKIIKDIVEKIICHLNSTYLHVTKYPVGIELRVQDMNSLLRIGLNDIRIIGICAMGGMGKTTVAKAIYNQFFHSFECKSFLANVREVSEQPNGQVSLQEKLLVDTLRLKNVKVSNVDRGINVIRERLCNKRVFIVLDDVDHLEQINAIAGERDWFNLGSRIIITTRNRHLLEQIGVDSIYTIKELNSGESLELFSWHAFRRSHPKEDYVELSKDVISYCKGLPLALEVIGSFLFGRCVAEWGNALDRLKRIPHNQILKKLRLSFDALDVDQEKDIFLDIACFFTGVDKDYVVKILDGCGFYSEIGISVLVERCLITINHDNKLTMHDMIRDMGREIIREKSPKEPGKCSRLWFYDDVLHVLTECTGTEAVEGLALEVPALNEACLRTDAFRKMHKLRLLQLNYVNLVGGYDHIFKKLRWLCWHGFPLKFIPNTFHVEDLIVLDMSYSNLREVWKQTKVARNLKILNLSHSRYLTKTPDLSQLPNLERLILEGCTSLVKIHPSIGHLSRLVILNMENCTCLRILPSSICKLKSLEILNLSGCSKLENFPKDIGAMEALVELLADKTAIREVPFSIVRLKNLSILSLRGCKGSMSPSSSWASTFLSWVSWVAQRRNPEPTRLLPASLQGLSFLTNLSLEDCNLSDEIIPNDLGRLSSLKELNLRMNNFCSLPTNINNLPKLVNLWLDHCTRLKSLPELPENLTVLSATGCTSLERLSDLSRSQSLMLLYLEDCHRLVDIPGLDKSELCSYIDIKGCNSLAKNTKENLQQLWSGSRGLSGVTLPWHDDCGDQQCMGSSLCFEVPPTMDVKIYGFTLFIVFTSTDMYMEYFGGWLTVTNMSKGLVWNYKLTTYDIPSGTEHTWWSYLPHFLFDDELDSWDQVEVVVVPNDGFNVEKCGIRLSYYGEDENSELSNQSDGGELIMYESASNKNAYVAGDDGDVSTDQRTSNAKRDCNDDDDDNVEMLHAKRAKVQSFNLFL